MASDYGDMETTFCLAAPRFAGLALSIQGLDDETHPRPEVPLCHGHHYDGRLTTYPRCLLALAF